MLQAEKTRPMEAARAYRVRIGMMAGSSKEVRVVLAMKRG
jgi:hypothetical protein